MAASWVAFNGPNIPWQHVLYSNDSNALFHSQRLCSIQRLVGRSGSLGGCDFVIGVVGGASLLQLLRPFFCVCVCWFVLYFIFFLVKLFAMVKKKKKKMFYPTMFNLFLIYLNEEYGSAIGAAKCFACDRFFGLHCGAHMIIIRTIYLESHPF